MEPDRKRETTEKQKKGEDPMSAYAQTYAYVFDKKKPGAKDLPVMSAERMQKISESVEKFLPKKQKK